MPGSRRNRRSRSRRSPSQRTMAINPPTRVQNGADKTRDSCLSSPDWRPRIRTNLPCPATSELHQPFPQSLQRLMCAAPRPESVRAIHKVLLVHRLQHHQHRALQDFVLQRWNANRACLARPRLLQMHPAHRRRSIPPGLEPFEQPRQVRLQFGLVLRRRHAIDTRRRVLAYSPVGFAHPHLIDMVRQRRQGQLRLSLSQLRYLALSC